jgi:hypothetical protein
VRVRALEPLNHKGRTARIGEVIELEDEAAKTLIKLEKVEEVKDTVAPVGVNTKVIENKQIEGKENV